MPKKGLTAIGVVLDKSGSMQARAEDARGGFNQFIEEQKEVDGEATLTLVQFDEEYQVDFVDKPLAEVPPLDKKNYRPRGWTALIDGLCRCIDEMGAKFEALPEEERPEKVVVIVITDGEENRSKEYTLAQLQNKIKTQRDEFDWQFVFMGASEHAIRDAKTYGMRPQSITRVAQTSKGVGAGYSGMSCAVSGYRGGQSASVNVPDVIDGEDDPDTSDDD